MFRLGGRGNSLSLLVFARCLGLYSSAEIREEGFKVYFQGGLRNDDYFNANDCWVSISSEDQLRLSRSASQTIRSPVLRVLQKTIRTGPTEFVTKLAKKMQLLTEDVLDGAATIVLR
ncbi:hypothetical protein Tco_1168630 [Tanacetum coccineum]